MTGMVVAGTMTAASDAGSSAADGELSGRHFCIALEQVGFHEPGNSHGDVGLAIAMLSVTGVGIWAHKRRPRLTALALVRPLPEPA